MSREDKAVALDSLGFYRQLVEGKWRAGFGGYRSRDVEKECESC